MNAPSNILPTSPIFDSLMSFLSGMGVPGRDKGVGLNYANNIITRDQLELSYRTDWIARKIVDLPAKDATRAWRTWQTSNPHIEKLEEVEKALMLQKKLYTGLRLARLFGGAALVLGLDQGQASDEVNIDAVKKGSLKFVHVVSMHNLATGPIVTDLMSPYYGEPSYYTTFSATPLALSGKGLSSEASSMLQIHPSRVVVLRGNDFPDTQSASLGVTNPFWGDSVLQTALDAVKATTMVTQATASLVNETKIDIIKIPELSQNMASQAYRDRLSERFSYANVSKSFLNTLILDKEEEWQRINTSFSELPDLIRVYLLIVSAAADIPATRMLGQSPAGLSATGESDTRNYYDRISSDQETDLKPALSKLDEVLLRSVLGTRDPSIFYNWRPLWQLDNAQSADIAYKKAQTFQIDVNVGLIDPEALRIGRQNQLIEDGTYPGLEEALEAQEVLSEESMLTPEEQEAQAVAKQEEQLFLQKQLQSKPGLPFKDATPRTLYVYRPLLNYREVVKWAKSRGFETTVGSDMHVTIAFSRQPVDWMKAGEAYYGGKAGKMTVVPGGPRLVEKLGTATVLLFGSSELGWRHESIKRDAGASWDFEGYQPHITITYDPPEDLDLDDIEPYRGELIFGPECFEEVEDSYKESLTEDAFEESKHPRGGKGTREGGKFVKGSGHPIEKEESSKEGASEKKSEEKKSEASSTSSKVMGHNEQMDQIFGVYKYLDMVAKHQGALSPARFIQENGAPFTVNEKTFAGKRGPMKMCFMNSAKAAMDNPELTYVEGYITMMGVPLEHAWTVDASGQVFDPTIRATDKIGGYFGVPFNTKYLMKTVLENGYYGLLGWHSLNTAMPLVKGEITDFKETPDPEKISQQAIGDRIAHADRVIAYLPSTEKIDTPERQALHKKIEDELYNRNIDKRSHGRNATIVLGLPGAGKSTFANPLLATGALEIEGDNAKALLPEFRGGQGAFSVHEEASVIMRNVLKRAIENGDDIVWPRIDSKDKIVADVESLVKQGYKVNIRLVDTSIEDSAKSATMRFLQTGRFVSPMLIAKYGTTPSESYAAAKATGLLASAERYTRKFGESMVKVEE